MQKKLNTECHILAPEMSFAETEIPPIKTIVFQNTQEFVKQLTLGFTIRYCVSINVTYCITFQIIKCRSAHVRVQGCLDMLSIQVNKSQLLGKKEVAFAHECPLSHQTPEISLFRPNSESWLITQALLYPQVKHILKHNV